MSKICFITAIYGNYEASCKKFAEQTIKTDFICFTDNKKIISNGWTVNNTPYHLINKSILDDNTQTNSIRNNKHTFNAVSKYYKQAFKNIPILMNRNIVCGSKYINNETGEFFKDEYDIRYVRVVCSMN